MDPLDKYDANTQFSQKSEVCLLCLHPDLIMAHRGIVMQMMLCISELQDRQAETYWLDNVHLNI